MKEQYDFFAITTVTKNNKTLYFWFDNNGNRSWTFNKQDACVWDDDDTAKAFGNSWFNKFNGWKVESIVLTPNLDVA